MTATKILAAMSAAALLGAAGTANATSFESNGRTTEVRYHDLDLTKEAGQRALNARIKRAAAKVCPAQNSNEAKKCQTVAIANLRAPVNAAIAKAQSRSQERFAQASEEKVPGAGN